MSSPHRFVVPTRWLLCLALLAMAWRAVLPVGLMPDAHALGEGRLVLTFCTADGQMQSFALDIPAQDSEQAAPDDCRFAVAGAAALTGPGPALSLPVPTAALVNLHPRLAVAPPLPAAGPPLGSRAPPLRHARLG